MKPEDYTVEYCPWCEEEVVIHAEGITACPTCGKPLAPCSVCWDTYGGCCKPCPYGCTGGEEDERKPVTTPPITQEEIDFVMSSDRTADAFATKPAEEDEARRLIERFAERQRGGHFACPRCGKMAMDTESVTRNALSRRADVYVCDTCGMLEGIEDMPENFKLPLSAWAITKKPEAWGMPLQLTFVGRDSWSRPVYKCGGRLYVDVNPREDCQPDICTKQGNSFDGEPCDPLSEGTEVEFIPRRDTW